MLILNIVTVQKRKSEMKTSRNFILVYAEYLLFQVYAYV